MFFGRLVSTHKDEERFILIPLLVTGAKLWHLRRVLGTCIGEMQHNNFQCQCIGT